MGAHQNHLPEKRVRKKKRGHDEGGEKNESANGEEREVQGGELPPVQMLVILICSISTITGPACSLIIISVILNCNEDLGQNSSGCREQGRINTFHFCF